MRRPPPTSTLFPYTTLFRSSRWSAEALRDLVREQAVRALGEPRAVLAFGETDRKSTRLNSSHRCISYAVFCLKKKKKTKNTIKPTDSNTSEAGMKKYTDQRD